MKQLKKCVATLKLWWHEQNKDDIMLVTYNLETNYLECVDWCSTPIHYFCGEYSEKLWKQIEAWSLINRKFPRANTVIYIWAGMEKKHLAYNEPIAEYFKNPALLQTGNGFHWGSADYQNFYYKHKVETCPTCKRPVHK